MIKDKNDSISIRRGKTGVNGWDIKLYFDDDKEDYKDIVEQIKLIDEELKKSFK